jgi:hypothetical protein
MTTWVCWGKGSSTYLAQTAAKQQFGVGVFWQPVSAVHAAHRISWLVIINSTIEKTI